MLCTVLDAILIISETWERVSQKNLRHAGFKNLQIVSSDEDDIPCAKLFPMTDEQNNISFAQSVQNLRPTLSTDEVKDFIDVHNYIAISATATEYDTVK